MVSPDHKAGNQLKVFVLCTRHLPANLVRIHGYRPEHSFLSLGGECSRCHDSFTLVILPYFMSILGGFYSIVTYLMSRTEKVASRLSGV